MAEKTCCKICRKKEGCKGVCKFSERTYLCDDCVPCLEYVEVSRPVPFETRIVAV